MIMKALEEKIVREGTVLPGNVLKGYYYAIATISQSTYRREEILSLLQVITDYFKSNQPDKLSLLKRNMDVLKKGYPDLGEIVF